MLVSHRKRFIYLKTPKTAGTSVEIFFERYCKPESEADVQSEARPEHISEDGIIGYRGADSSGATWRNHMSASEVRALLGEDIWAGYFKFCVIRNPFDQLVSLWWMTAGRPQAAQAEADMEFTRSAFSAWLLARPSVDVGSGIYTINGKLGVDATIRYETLLPDVARICERIGVPADTDRLGRFKGAFRRRSEDYRAYYSEAARSRVERAQAQVLAMLGYQF